MIEDGKYLGKIASVRVGFGGYQEDMFGFFLSFSGDFGSADTDRCFYLNKLHTPEGPAAAAGLFLLIGDTLRISKKQDISQLVGVPVEIEIASGSLRQWRVLTEVL